MPYLRRASASRHAAGRMGLLVRLHQVRLEFADEMKLPERPEDMFGREIFHAVLCDAGAQRRASNWSGS